MQELTRHAANLGMIAAATANPLRSKHFYLGFQAEHKLAAASAQAPCISTPLCLTIMGFGQAECLAELYMHWCNLQPRGCFPWAPCMGLQPNWATEMLCPALPRQQGVIGDRLCAGAGQLTDLSGHNEVRMQAKVGVFGRGMASVKIQYFVEGQLYGLFKVTPEAKPLATTV